MERPISHRRNVKVTDPDPPLSIPLGNETNSKHGKRFHRRHYPFLAIRDYECLHCMDVKRMIVGARRRQQHAVVNLLLVLSGIIGIVQISRQFTSFPSTATVRDGVFPLIEAPLIIPRGVSGETIMRDASYETRPRCMGVYFPNVRSDGWSAVERLDDLRRTQMSRTTIPLSKRDVRAQVHLTNSRDYRHGRRDEVESGDCKLQHEWQLKSFPTCNALHEHDLTRIGGSSSSSNSVQLLGAGYWRDVWVVKDDGNGSGQAALKTLRYEHAYEDRNYDRHRRDALAMERLTSSNNIMGIFGYCGNSGIFEFADGGDMEDMIWYAKDKWNTTEKLIVAYQVATAIADVHEVEGNGRVSIAHTDITTSQFVHSEGRYKLNDFNRCRFITWNEKTDKQCGFHVGNNPGNFRSPEEYNYEMETEKIDVYSMGNVFYTLLTEQWPFGNAKSEDAQRRVKAGQRPHIPSRLQESTDPAIVAMRRAMTMCWRHDPNERASARDVANMLHKELKAQGVRSEDQ